MSFSVSSPTAGGDSLIIASPAPGAGGLQSFLVPLFVEPLDVVVASQDAISRLQFTPQQVQEVTGKMAPPVVDLAHYYVSGAWNRKGKCLSDSKSVQRSKVNTHMSVHMKGFFFFFLLPSLTSGQGLLHL